MSDPKVLDIVENIDRKLDAKTIVVTNPDTTASGASGFSKWTWT